MSCFNLVWRGVVEYSVCYKVHNTYLVWCDIWYSMVLWKVCGRVQYKMQCTVSIVEFSWEAIVHMAHAEAAAVILPQTCLVHILYAL